jgi:putative hydrolase of the HAD superfamily
MCRPSIGFPNLHRIRAITLDLDDTLWAIEPVIRRAEAELHDWLGEHYPAIGECFSPEASLELRNQVMKDHWHKSHDFRFLRKKVLARMAEASGYSEALVEDAFAVFDAARNRVDLFPDVEPALSALADRFTLVAVTNGNANLEIIGIDHHFHDVVTAVDAGAAKPARPIFAEAVRRAGVEFHETLHVGDHPELDVAGAADAGLRTAWMNRLAADWPDHLAPPDVTVRTVHELHDMLDAAAIDRK